MNNIYEFIIISPKGELTFYDDYTKKVSIERKDEAYILNQDLENRFENIKGICEAVKVIVCNLSPTTIYSFKNFSTNIYKFSIFELPTKLRFIIISEKDNRDYEPLLKSIYSEIYCESVPRNILNRGNKIRNLESFRLKVQDLISYFK